MITLPIIEALGTQIRIEIFDNLSEEKAQTTYGDLCLFIKQFDQKYSNFFHFKNESIICNLNDSGFLLEPDQMTIDLLQYGLNLYHQTNGEFNFLVSDAVEKSAFKAIYSQNPSNESVTTPDPTQVLSITKEKIILAKGQVNIGGYSKGYLIDIIANELKNTYQINEFLINGGSCKYATTKYTQPLKISLEHPTISGAIVAETSLYNEGFAVSSTFKRTDKVPSHIIDSKTGESHNNALGVYVKAASAGLADAWAATLLISAPDNHLPALQSHAIKLATYSEQEKKFKEWGKFF